MEDQITEPLLTNRQTDPHHWVRMHADYLYAYAITRINDQDLAKDLVQETFLAALERVAHFEGKSSERTWLTAILKNKIIDVYRKRSSGLRNIDEKRALRETDDFFMDEEGGHWKREHIPREFELDQHDPLAQKEFEKVLKLCLHKLPALWLSVFTMKHMDDVQTEVICSELKVSASNFWVIIHRAKVNLRACLQKNWI